MILSVFATSKLVQRPDALFEPFFSSDPELFPVLHDVCEYGTAEEDHMLPTGRILDTNLEFL